MPTLPTVYSGNGYWISGSPSQKSLISPWNLQLPKTWIQSEHCSTVSRSFQSSWFSNLKWKRTKYFYGLAGQKIHLRTCAIVYVHTGILWLYHLKIASYSPVFAPHDHCRDSWPAKHRMATEVMPYTSNSCMLTTIPLGWSSVLWQLFLMLILEKTFS